MPKSKTKSKTDLRALKSGKVRFRFPVYPNQAEIIRAALEKAKKEAGTEYDAVAFERICLSYLSSSSFATAEVVQSIGDDGTA